jgi:hypothetical protein
MLLFCGCAGKSESEDTRKTSKPIESKSDVKTPTVAKPPADVKITFYVKGMSNKLHLT